MVGGTMRNTDNIVDKIIIYIGCLMLYAAQSDFSINVVVMLVPVIFSALLSYFDDDRVCTVLVVGFSVLTCFVPSFIVFLPLIAYDMLYGKYRYLHLIGVIPIVLAFQSPLWRTTFVIMAMLPVSLLMRYQSWKQMSLRTKYNDLLDEAREMSLQMKKQNSDLIEKQDFELSNATLNERNRIAREIHDNVGHLLSSAILQSGALLTINKDEKVDQSLKTLKDTLNQAMDSIRASVHQLHDESMDLEAQILKLTAQFTFCELKCDYQISSNPDKKVKYAFLSVIREALSNMIRHSNATQASIVLREHPALYQLIIRDNGTDAGYSTDEGMGLKNMMDRVEALKGNINIQTQHGFEIFISIPKEEPV